MSKIIKESWIEETEYYTLDFDLKADPSGGYTFPCDKNGNVKKLNPAAKENYEYVKTHMDRYFEPRVLKHIEHITHYPVIRCDCGESFELRNEFYATCECPGCGQWYNLFGQKTLSPDEYRDHEDFDDGEYEGRPY